MKRLDGRGQSVTVKFQIPPSGLVRVWQPPQPRRSGGFLNKEVLTYSDRGRGDGDEAGSVAALAGGSGPVEQVSEPPPAQGSGAELDNRCEFETFRNRITRFGLRGRRSLREAGAVMERLAASPSECVFLTGTIPSVEPLAWAAVAQYSAWIVHRLKAWVNKRCPAKFDFYCWEWQGRGALHLHYCVWVPDPVARAKVLELFQPRWVGWLRQVQELSGVFLFRGKNGEDWSEQPEKVQAWAVEVEKSVGSYLSKYMSKGSAASDPAALEAAGYFFPSRWWGTSRPLKAAIRELTSEGVLEAPGRSDVTILEEFRHKAESWECPVYSYKNRVGSGETVIAVTSGLEAGLELMYSLDSEGIMPRDVKATAEERAFQAIAMVEGLSDEVYGFAQQDGDEPDSELSRHCREIEKFTAMVFDEDYPPSTMRLYAVTFEMIPCVRKLQRLAPLRAPKYRVDPIVCHLLAARRALRPKVMAKYEVKGAMLDE